MSSSLEEASSAPVPPLGFEDFVLVSPDDYYEHFEEDEEERLLNSNVVLLEGVVLTTVSVLGLVGTLMAIYVLLKPRLRDCFSTFLTGLAVCDAVFLFFAILMFGMPMLWTW